MSTKIEWARNADGSQGETWNPIQAGRIDGHLNASITGKLGTGCTKVSPGCNACYAGTMNRRFYGNDYSYKSKPSEWTIDEKILELPMRTQEPTTFFVASMCDLFHETIPASIQEDVLQIMLDNSHHLFLLLTKRPESMRDSLNAFYADRSVPPMDNVWCGVSAENQEMADERIPLLLDTPAAKRFVSCEPLLGPVDLKKWLPVCVPGTETHLFSYRNGYQPFVNWAIVGGESGPKARPMHPMWVLALRGQCEQAGIPFFFKQWGQYKPLCRYYSLNDVKREWALSQPHVIVNFNGSIWHDMDGQPNPDYCPWIMRRTNKKAAGRLLMGNEYNQMPERT